MFVPITETRKVGDTGVVGHPRGKAQNHFLVKKDCVERFRVSIVGSHISCSVHALHGATSISRTVHTH